MNDERAAEGIDHLQAAALEMISAARAFLDVMEEVVTDKAKVAAMVGVMGTAAQAVKAAARVNASGFSADDKGDDGRVQHIRVS